MRITGKELLKKARTDNPCMKRTLLNKTTGEIKLIPCGRRYCPRCAASYASLRGRSMDAVHGKLASHVVLTVSDDHINRFATEFDYQESKEYTREITRKKNYALSLTGEARKIALLKVFSNIPVTQPRNRIYWSSTEGSKAIRRIRESCGNTMERDPETIGYCRAVEFGEKKGRWHLHLLLLQEIGILVYTYAEYLKYDEDREIFYGNIPDWPYGMVRIKELKNFKGGLWYILSYVKKSCPGRLTFDKFTRERIRMDRELISAIYKRGDADADFEFIGLGKEYQKLQSEIDENYTKLLNKVKNDADNKRFFNSSDSEITPRRYRRKSTRT